MKLTLADVQRCLGNAADEGQESVAIRAVRTDSRAVEPGDLFICLPGEHFDGHEFAAQAAKKGAAAVIASRLIDDAGAPVIMVQDTVAALGRLAACWRDICGARLIAVTGTAGKTTVKEMLSAVLSRKFTVAKNYRNLNNQIGLPLSMLRADAGQELWIMELGISHKRDMEELAPIASPDLAVITNVGPGHLEGLGDVEGVARAKTALLRYLRQGGSAIIGRDYPALWAAACEIAPAPIGFSADPAITDTDFAAAFLGGAGSEGWGRFRLRTPEGESEFDAPFAGDHYAANLACVAAVAHQLGLGRDDVVAGLKTLVPDRQRFCCRTVGYCTVIDDTYNANPLSMAGSIRTAASMAGDRELVLVLGDMRELGAEAAMRHEELGRLLRGIELKAIFYKGDHFADVARGLGDGMKPVKVTGPDDFIAGWRELSLGRSVALFKGSRSLGMEAFAGALCRELEQHAGEEA
ncbi:UDP-N-acetylmuramoyl-tripeptide--D-alanyl-D-alanine ligase [Pseudodesulfovibrio sp.]|uniref:UDP-N-acetylmuramoyl-tripeptide--D-alanyl-D- alanine ligase n=1 Tax=Pseudodesulfovibrio sp. TaxID=2035812 RepID=UPI00260C68BD|nr:UDP-N-acetylmuramoyl-tripeptide--D-alanyl-D-alanine ligase [Pseudodesulfovibrio sp.]MDD3312611.1 UDP-N-acetylmuramoyl-tripeptide--D-alanyl-D-alanine ligase [Pseudodesulfovibrio sp.]